MEAECVMSYNVYVKRWHNLRMKEENMYIDLINIDDVGSCVSLRRRGERDC